MKRKPRGTLYLCGLGCAPSRAPTLEVLQALRRCATVYCAEKDPQVLSLLRLFCPDCRPFPPRGGAARVLAALRGGRGAAWAVFGQPMVFGPDALALSRAARAEGIPVEIVGGLSAFDAMLSSTREVFGYGPGWYQILEDCRPEALALAGRLDPRLAAVAYLRPGAAPSRREAAVRALRSSYPSGRACRLFSLSPGGERVGERAATVGKLSAAPAGARACFIIVSPEGHEFR